MHSDVGKSSQGRDRCGFGRITSTCADVSVGSARRGPARDRVASQKANAANRARTSRQGTKRVMIEQFRMLTGRSEMIVCATGRERIMASG